MRPQLLQATGVGLLLGVLAALPAAAQTAAPDRRADEGDGPHQTLVIRNVTVIDGTGAPPFGPANIIIEGNRITQVRTTGYPGLPVAPFRGPEGAKVIDGTGMYVMPGFVDLHVHAGGAPKNPGAEYAYKLWLAHGVTTVRGVGLGGLEWSVSEKRRSEANQIVAPRIFAYANPGSGRWQGGPVTTPQAAREWVRWAAQQGIDGLKLTAHEPDVMAALIDEARKHDLGTTAHLAQLGVARMNARDAARLGLHSMEHFYGLFEALLKDRAIQDFPVDYNYQNEQHRFGQVARLWNQIHAPGSPEWNDLIREFIELGFVIDPTMGIYSASRDLMRARNADWHEKYTLPSMMEFYQPSRAAHGSYWFDWTTADEIAWRNFYRVWMQFLNDYKNAGGRVTTGSDSGFIYQLYGFGYITELELLQEAGFHPLEVVRAATMHGADALYEPKGRRAEFGTLKAGMLADLVLVEHNPLQNFKVLYGTGHFRLNDETNRPEFTGGVRYTIKDGIIYDARQLLADVERMVQAQRVAERQER
jgi:imidazolonepropionase-like amidohydrolase